MLQPKEYFIVFSDIDDCIGQCENGGQCVVGKFGFQNHLDNPNT